MKTAKAAVEIRKDNEGTWLDLDTGDRTATISLSHSPGQTIHEFFTRNLEKAKPVRHTIGTWSKRTVAYTTGACALLIVTVSAVAALLYAATHGPETLNNLATSTLTGIGMAIGGCLGSALILRFKTARQYVRSVLKDLQ